MARKEGMTISLVFLSCQPIITCASFQGDLESGSMNSSLLMFQWFKINLNCAHDLTQYAFTTSFFASASCTCRNLCYEVAAVTVKWGIYAVMAAERTWAELNDDF